MIRVLRFLFSGIFVFMVGVSIWASLQQNILDCWPGLVSQPWAMATLGDAYSGFLTFYAWVFYKETGFLARAAWFILIMALGNIAMAFYMLLILFRLPPNASSRDILLRKGV